MGEESRQMENWLARARENRPVWLGEVRRAWEEDPDTASLVLQVTLPGGGQRDFRVSLPRRGEGAEGAFRREVLRFVTFNVLSVVGGEKLTFCPEDPSLIPLVEQVLSDFGPGSRYRKAVSVAGRVCRAAGRGDFRFEVATPETFRPAPPEIPSPGDLPARARDAARRACSGLLCGVDIGGSDLRLVLVEEGRIVEVRERDWNPGLSPTPEGILLPIRDLIRGALERSAPGRLLDGLGISFPDVVVRNRIVGGETPKTRGMRLQGDYEARFREITALADFLSPLCRQGAPVGITNDGHMAAVTAAVELAWGGRGEELAAGVVAHTLGTDLGTGWLSGDGTIPEMPMEVYAMLLNLGSLPDRNLPPGDLRSLCNENSGLPDLRRLVGQDAAFRLAQASLPEELAPFTRREGEKLYISRVPDLRKSALARLMELAAGGEEAAMEIFREIGRALGQVCRELEWLCPARTRTRFLFGRFVKDPRCFALLQEGCRQSAPEFHLVAADPSLAHSPLMAALAAWPGVTVAQYAQAVGAIHYCLLSRGEEGSPSP